MVGPVIHQRHVTKRPAHSIAPPWFRASAAAVARPCRRARCACARAFVPAIETLAQEKFARTGRRRQPVRSATRATDVELEAAVPRFRADGRRDSLPGCRRTARAGSAIRAGLFLRPRPLDGEVEKARRAPVAGDLVDRLAVDPGLQVDEIGCVAAELPTRRAEGVQYRIPRVLGLQREIERLAEVLRQEAEASARCNGVAGL